MNMKLIDPIVGFTINNLWIDKIFNDKQFQLSFEDKVDHLLKKKENKMEDALLLKLIKKEIGLKVLEGEPFTIFDITECIREWYRGELYHSDVRQILGENRKDIADLLVECSYTATNVVTLKGPAIIYHHNADDPMDYLHEINLRMNPTYKKPEEEDEDEDDCVTDLLDTITDLKLLMTRLISSSTYLLASNFSNLSDAMSDLRDSVDNAQDYLDEDEDEPEIDAKEYPDPEIDPFGILLADNV